MIVMVRACVWATGLAGLAACSVTPPVLHRLSSLGRMPVSSIAVQPKIPAGTITTTGTSAGTGTGNGAVLVSASISPVSDPFRPAFKSSF